MQSAVSASPATFPRRSVIPWAVLWVLYNVVVGYIGWTCWNGASYNKFANEMTSLEPWEWWMRVIEVWGLASACFAVGPLLEMFQLRWYRRTPVTKGVFFVLILLVSVFVIADWAIRFKNDYLIAGQAHPWGQWQPRE